MLSMNTHSLQKANSLGFPLSVIQDEGWPIDLTELYPSVILGEYIGMGKAEGSLILRCMLGILAIRLQKTLFCTEL